MLSKTLWCAAAILVAAAGPAHALKPNVHADIAKASCVAAGLPRDLCQRIATEDYDTDSRRQVVKILTPDGSTLRDLATFSGGSILGLAWSPDGLQLGFIQVTDTNASLYVIDRDGRNLRQAYNGADTGAAFVFSPDAKYVLVQTIDGTGQHLYAIELSTLDYRLVQVPGVALNEAWSYAAWRK